jgi:RNA polymerase sigma-70 factor (ECF subfamily)
MNALVSDLFERYHLAVFRFFRRLTENSDLAEDLTQEVFVRVLKGIREYQPQGREAGWLFRIARSVLVDHYRRTPQPGLALVDLEDADLCYPPGQLLAFGLQEALDRLPKSERSAFLFREVGGFSYSEVGALCDTTEDGVCARLFRARRRLRELLSGRLPGTGLPSKWD